MHEVDDDRAHQPIEGRFDEDDFEGAYRELDAALLRRGRRGVRRRCAHRWPSGSSPSIEATSDRVFGELTDPRACAS